ncbi:hypothetical protein [Candidatus Pseudoruminococcus sp.]|uniref:hypothetical protein n=1 Tax=Candidatus Pseudoruminococcus sp. TaxID=3101048 RepID=UPI00399AC563
MKLIITVGAVEPSSLKRNFIIGENILPNIDDIPERTIYDDKTINGNNDGTKSSRQYLSPFLAPSDAPFGKIVSKTQHNKIIAIFTIVRIIFLNFRE